MLTRSNAKKHPQFHRPGYDVPPGYFGQRWRDDLAASKIRPVTHHPLVGAAPEPGLPPPRKPGSVYVLGVKQLSDWLTDGPGRREIESTCRGWMTADPSIAEVRVVLESGEPMGTVRR